MSLTTRFPTHAAEIQPAALADYDADATDRALQETVRREDGAWGEERLERMGKLAGGELMQLGFEANLYKLRAFVGRIALALQASILLRAKPVDVAEAFCASRLDGRHGLGPGTLPRHVPHAALINRAWPRL